jgi:hypothetical protein
MPNKPARYCDNDETAIKRAELLGVETKSNFGMVIDLLLTTRLQDAFSSANRLSARVTNPI